MDRYSLLVKNPKLSKKVFGLEFDTLTSLLEKVKLLHAQQLEQNPLPKRGLRADFSLENQFLLTLEYLKTYQTFQVLGFNYGVSESYANKCYHKILDLVSKSIGLKNPTKLSYKKLKNIIINVTY